MSARGRDVTETIPLNIVAAVAAVRNHLGLRGVAAWSLRGSCAGGVVAVLIAGIGRLTPVPDAPVAGAVLLAVGLVAGVAVGVRRWPDHLAAARTVDRSFGLQDRVTTAFEFRTSALPLAALQRNDAGHHLDGLLLRSSARGQPRRREAAVLTLVLALFLVLAFSGVTRIPPRSIAAAGDSARIHRATGAQMDRIVRSVNANLTSAAHRDIAVRNLNAALQHLRFQLQHASNRAAALRAISATQQQLNRIASSLHPIRPASAAHLQHALAAATGSHASTSTGKGALKSAAAALNRLAAEIGHMSTAQRAALARSLARAANATTDSTLRNALQRAASSLGYNDPQSAIAALQSGAAALDRSPAASAAESKLAAAGTSLQSLKGQVTGLSSSSGTSSSSGSASGKGQKGGSGAASRGSGGGRGTGSGRGQGAGSGQGTGRGQGSGHGQGSGRGSGNSHGSGGTGGTGGHGAGGGRGGAGNHGRGRSGGRIFIPGKPGGGSHTIQNGPNGAPLSGSVVPYQQVIARYEQTARDALDRGALPPALQSYVRQYFSSISH